MQLDIDFFLECPQAVKIYNNLYSVITFHTGTPQGCHISLKLYSIFTFDCKPIHSGNLVIKFADDTTVTVTDNNVTMVITDGRLTILFSGAKITIFFFLNLKKTH